MTELQPITKTVNGFDLTFEGETVPEHFAYEMCPADVDELLLINRDYARMQAENERLREEREEYSMRLAGVLTVLEGASEKISPRPGTSDTLLPYVDRCPTYAAAWRLREEIERLKAELETARQQGAEAMRDKIDDIISMYGIADPTIYSVVRNMRKNIQELDTAAVVKEVAE